MNSTNRSNTQTSPSALNPTRPSVERGMIMICEKCGKKVSSDSDDNISKRMQKDLKHEAIEKFGAKQVRAVVSSCMDICPKDQLATCVIYFDKPAREPEFFVFDPAEIVSAKKQLLGKF